MTTRPRTRAALKVMPFPFESALKPPCYAAWVANALRRLARAGRHVRHVRRTPGGRDTERGRRGARRRLSVVERGRRGARPHLRRRMCCTQEKKSRKRSVFSVTECSPCAAKRLTWQAVKPK